VETEGSFSVHAVIVCTTSNDLETLCDAAIDVVSCRMSGLYYANVTVHVLAAMLWLGGMFFLGAVGAPVLRSIEPPPLRQRLFQELGARFRRVGWWAISVLVLTGVINLHYRGWLQWDAVFARAAFWRTAAGRALAAKLVIVALMISISAVHDFIHGPRAGRAAPASPEAMAFRRRAALIARVNAILGILLVAAAVRLARGG
jgi:copper resistance protein D